MWRASTERRARKDIGKALGVLNGALEGREFLLGLDYCLADTHVWSFASWLTVMGVSMEEYVNVKEWMKRVGGRPALKDE